MSRDFRHSKYSTRPARDDRKNTPRKRKTHQEREVELRHAVRNGDRDALDDYDDTDDPTAKY